ncbi:MAG: hypothetical protein R3C44_04680 [Chloroflexota bacterium]
MRGNHLGRAGAVGNLANGVTRQLNLEAEVFDVVLSGSLYKGGTMLTAPMQQTIHAVAPGARLVRLQVPPVTGGVLAYMERRFGYAVACPQLIKSVRGAL